MNMVEPFNYSGLALRSDLESPEWTGLYSYLEKIQNEFLSKEREFRSKEYSWPRDPLHTWSRAWEYPYTLYHLMRWREERPDQRTKIIDFGSGVTFFPFALAKCGYDVLAMDVDPICERDFKSAMISFPSRPGNVGFKRSYPTHIPLEDGSVSALYSVSVIEHIPDYLTIIDEIHRVLAPGGLCILTIDVSLDNRHEIMLGNYIKLKERIKDRFSYRVDEFPYINPQYYLNTENTIFPKSLSNASKSYLSKVLDAIRNRPEREIVFRACEGIVLEKKNP